MIITPTLAQTTEASTHNFWQEFDITFWQTLPFATLGMYFVETQMSNIMFPGSEVHWNAIMLFSTIISAGNAFIQAGEVVNSERTGRSN
jgi:hypothetical protein